MHLGVPLPRESMTRLENMFRERNLDKRFQVVIFFRVFPVSREMIGVPIKHSQIPYILRGSDPRAAPTRRIKLREHSQHVQHKRHTVLFL